MLEAETARLRQQLAELDAAAAARRHAVQLELEKHKLDKALALQVGLCGVTALGACGVNALGACGVTAVGWVHVG